MWHATSISHTNQYEGIMTLYTHTHPPYVLLEIVEWHAHKGLRIPFKHLSRKRMCVSRYISISSWKRKTHLNQWINQSSNQMWIWIWAEWRPSNVHFENILTTIREIINHNALLWLDIYKALIFSFPYQVQKYQWRQYCFLFISR